MGESHSEGLTTSGGSFSSEIIYVPKTTNISAVGRWIIHGAPKTLSCSFAHRSIHVGSLFHCQEWSSSEKMLGDGRIFWILSCSTGVLMHIIYFCLFGPSWTISDVLDVVLWSYLWEQCRLVLGVPSGMLAYPLLTGLDRSFFHGEPNMTS